MRTLQYTAVGLMVVAMMIAGCERQEYQPEAVSAHSEESDGETSSPNRAGPPSHHYSARLEGGELVAGDDGELVVEVYPSSDLRINLDFPWSLNFEETEGLELKTMEFDGEEMELSEEVAQIPVGARVEEPGEYVVSARGDFSVCNDEICHILRDEHVEFAVDAN